MSQKNALINPEMLQWCRRKAKLTEQEVADRICKGDVEKLKAWESGSAGITISQCRSLTSVYKTPLAVFYLHEPPEAMRIIPDFRTQKGDRPAKRSFELNNLTRKLIETQSWLHDFLTTIGSPEKEFVGSCSKRKPAEFVAELIRKTLGLNTEIIRGMAEPRQAFNYFRERTESCGVFVFKFSGIESSEARGIALPEKLAPVVFVNPQDSWTGQRFTLAHELAHIWINKAGISNLLSDQKIEIFCNRIASHVLLTDTDFNNSWSLTVGRPEIDRITFVASMFHVSREAVARKALDLGIIDSSSYGSVRLACRSDWEKSESASGGNYYTNQVSRYGREFIGVVMNGCQGGVIQLAEASRLLDTKVSNFQGLCESAQIGFTPTGGGI